MITWIGSISNIFGYILNFIYELVQNYGLAIILFTLLAKMLLFPLTYFQQKGMKKTAIINEEVKKIQEKYKGNEKKIQENTMDIYKNNNSSPLASCSSCIMVIIQMFLVLAMFYLVSEPLKYMRNIDTEKYQKYEIRMYKEVIAEKEAEETETEKNKNEEKAETKNQEEAEDLEEETEEDIVQLRAKSGIIRPQMEMIARYRDEDEAFNINTSFLGLDLTNIPSNSIKSFNFNDKETYIVLVNLIIPILYMAISILNVLYTGKSKKSNNELEKIKEEVKEKAIEEVLDEKQLKIKAKEDEKLSPEDINDAMKDANKSMVYFLPIVMFFVTMNAPLSLALYWLTNTLLSFVEKTIVEKLVNKQEDKNKTEIVVKAEKSNQKK